MEIGKQSPTKFWPLTSSMIVQNCSFLFDINHIFTSWVDERTLVTGKYMQQFIPM